MSEEHNEVLNLAAPFDVMLLDDSEVTAAVIVASEMTRKYAAILAHVARLAQDTWVEHLEAEGDIPARTITHDHPHLYKWMDLARKMLMDIAKVNQEAEVNQMVKKFNLQDAFKSAENMPKALAAELTKFAIGQRLIGEEHSVQ